MILIKNAKILTMAGINYENGCILIDNGKIIEVNNNITENEKYEVIDANGGWVIPGIIEAHCHLGMHEEDLGFEGDDTNEATEPITAHLRAIDAVNPLDPAFEEAVKAGVTTVMTGPGSANVIGGQFITIKTYGTCIDDMIVLEPSALKVAFGENPKRVYKNKNKIPSTRMGTAALLRETLNSAKNYKNKKLKAIEKNESFDIDLKMEALLPVIDKKIPLKAHAHRADDLLTAIRIAKEFDVLLTLDHCTDGAIIVDKIKEANVPAIIGPTMTFRTKVETKNKSFFTPKILSDAGITISLTTDHPVTPIQYLPLCAGLAAKEGLGIEDALKAITINPAKIIGIDDKVGSIEIGKEADIVVYDGNPLEIFTNTLYTIIKGQIVYKRN